MTNDNKNSLVRSYSNNGWTDASEEAMNSLCFYDMPSTSTENYIE